MATKPGKRERIKSKESPQTILFRGKKYWLGREYMTSKQAKKSARELISQGFKIRIIPTTYSVGMFAGYHNVYVRPEPKIG